MFDVDCPTHGTKVLLPASRIRALANTDRGIIVILECYDGTEVGVVTGRAQAA